MLDLISILLNFISLLQNATRKTKLEEKVNEVKQAMSRVVELFHLLTDAKKSHDGFEKFAGTGAGYGANGFADLLAAHADTVV